MSDPLKHVTPGDGPGMLFRADSFNLHQDAARDYLRRRMGKTGAGIPDLGRIFPSLTVDLFNPASSIETLDAYSVVTYGNLLTPIDDASNLRDQSSEDPCFQLGTPAAATDQFLVTLEPIAGQKIGRAVLAGLAVVQIDVTDASHTRAVPVAGETGHLASAASGGVPIVWKPSGTGLLWCWVRIDETGSGFDLGGGSGSGANAGGSGGGTTAVGQFTHKNYRYTCDDDGLHEIEETITVELEIVNGQIVTTTTVT